MIDQYLESSPASRGAIINGREFQGWDCFAAPVQHLRFIRDHQRRIRRGVLVTDSPV